MLQGRREIQEGTDPRGNNLASADVAGTGEVAVTVQREEYVPSRSRARAGKSPRIRTRQPGPSASRNSTSSRAVARSARHRRIALIGLRGAGKSTLGAALAQRLSVPFLELDRLIEQESGLTLSLIFDFRGQAGFRELERRFLEDVLQRYPCFVLATGGSLVSEPGTFERLLASCFTSRSTKVLHIA